jgi:hypothetical protein
MRKPPDPNSESKLGIFIVCIFLLIAFLCFGFVSFNSPESPNLSVSLTGFFLIDDIMLAAVVNPVSFGLFLASAIVLAYFLLYEFSLRNWKTLMDGLKPSIEDLKGKKKESLLRVSRQAHERSMLDMGSLFIPTAFVLLAAAATAQNFISHSARIGLALSALLLYVVWLFLVQLPTRLMDDVDSKMRLIAKDAAAEILHNFYGDRHGTTYMTRLRRNHWLAYVPLLTLGATLIIGSILRSR